MSPISCGNGQKVCLYIQEEKGQPLNCRDRQGQGWAVLESLLLAKGACAAAQGRNIGFSFQGYDVICSSSGCATNLPLYNQSLSVAVQPEGLRMIS